MKTTMKGKRNPIAAIKSAVLQNILMNRFIHEIEREEPLESELLKTMVAFQTQPVR